MSASRCKSRGWNSTADIQNRKAHYVNMESRPDRQNPNERGLIIIVLKSSCEPAALCVTGFSPATGWNRLNYGSANVLERNWKLQVSHWLVSDLKSSPSSDIINTHLQICTHTDYSFRLFAYCECSFSRHNLELIAVAFTPMASGVPYPAWHYSQLVYCSR